MPRWHIVNSERRKFIMQLKESRKILSLLLALMMVMAIFAGCGGDQEEPGGTDDPVVEDPISLDVDEVLLEGATSILNNIPDNNFIMAADEALQLVEDNPGAVFWVDLRSAEDYAAGHIVGAVNIPYGKVGANLGSLPTNKQIIFQCYSGQTSAQVTSLAQMLGYNAVSFRGGMKFGWTPLNLGEDSLETTENPLPQAVTPDLDEKGQILWDAVVAYFQPDQNYIISPADLDALVNDNPDAIMVLDIRSAEDFGKGHIPGAINVPFKTVGNNLDQLSKTKPVYTTCYTGQTAGITIAMLRVAGFNAISLSRGMTGWVDEAGLPTVTE
jgi:rhodanese-related sulfurtransferase